MLYRNDSVEAIKALESQRLGNYGNDFYDDDFESKDYYDEWDLADLKYDEIKSRFNDEI